MTRPQREGRVRDVVARRPEDERDAVIALRPSQLRVEGREGRYRCAEDPGVLRIRPRAEPQAPLLDGVCRRRRRDLRGNQNVTASSC